MKRLILCLLVTIAGLHTVVAEPVILPVKTDTAPFFFYYDELPSDSYNLTVHYVANGTKATILGWVENGAKLKVVLEDGSIGYMPTIAFSYEKNMRFTLLKHIDEKEDQLLGIGKWQDENGNPSLTSVDTVEVDKDAEFIFDLQGRRVITPERGGIYIINGNKVIY